MTLVIGIKCTTGLVLGADGAASLGAMGQMTALQPTKKLFLLENKAIYGGAGFVGLSQRIEAKVKGRVTHFSNQDKAEIMADLRKHVWTEILDQEFKVAQATAPVVGNQVAGAACLNAWLIAGVAKNKEPFLIQFDHAANPEAASDNLPFVAIGSGQTLADPFLAFIRRIFWPARLPTLAEGEFAVWWALHHAIKASPGGVANPKQLMVLQKDGDKFTPHELTDEECKEHEEAVGRVEEYLADFEIDGGDAGQPQAPVIPPGPPAPTITGS